MGGIYVILNPSCIQINRGFGVEKDDFQDPKNIRKKVCCFVPLMIYLLRSRVKVSAQDSRKMPRMIYFSLYSQFRDSWTQGGFVSTAIKRKHSRFVFSSLFWVFGVSFSIVKPPICWEALSRYPEIRSYYVLSIMIYLSGVMSGFNWTPSSIIVLINMKCFSLPVCGVRRSIWFS